MVQVQVLELNGRPMTNTHFLDISPHGARLEAPFPLFPHFRVNIRFLLPGTDNEASMFAHVMWVRPIVTSPGRYQIGLRFNNPLWELVKLFRESPDQPLPA